jgi:hypothetical protein
VLDDKHALTDQTVWRQRDFSLFRARLFLQYWQKEASFMLETPVWAQNLSAYIQQLRRPLGYSK